MVAKKPGALLQAILRRIRGDLPCTNKSHSSLGPNLKPGCIASARRTFERLLTYGIRPDETVVDYGCALRLGAFFIDYLEPDRFIGLDIDQRILAAGRGQLADERR